MSRSNHPDRRSRPHAVTSPRPPQATDLVVAFPTPASVALLPDSKFSSLSPPSHSYTRLPLLALFHLHAQTLSPAATSGEPSRSAMEHLFMQAFESRDRVAAQVQQQADFYSQTLASSLLAAGHQPPEWLIPSTTLPQGASQLPPLHHLLFRLRAGDSGGS
jgi:hypothetical protein